MEVESPPHDPRISTDPQGACLLVSIPSPPVLAVHHHGPDTKSTPLTNFCKQHSLTRHMNMLKTCGSWRAHVAHRTANNLEIPNVHNLISKIHLNPFSEPPSPSCCFLCPFSRLFLSCWFLPPPSQVALGTVKIFPNRQSKSELPNVCF